MAVEILVFDEELSMSLSMLAVLTDFKVLTD